MKLPGRVGGKNKEFSFLHWLWGFGVFISFLIVDWQNAPVRDSNPMCITDSFTQANLNTKALYNTTFSGQASPGQPLDRLIEQTFTPNEQPDKIVLGRSYNNHQAWVYLKLINQDNKARKLVLQADHVRLDAVTLYRIDKQDLIPLGHVSRTIPIARRHYTFRAFALPLTIAPRDTIRLLLHTQRYTGLQETSLTLYSELLFIEHAIHNDFKNSFRVIYVLIIIIVMVVLGSLFQQWYMYCFSGMLFGLCCIFLYMGNYFDSVPFPSFLCLNTSNIGAFSTYLANVLFHPFGYAVMKSVSIVRRRFVQTAVVLAGLNLGMMVLITGWIPLKSGLVLR